MLCKKFGVKPGLLSFPGMEVLKNFLLSSGRELLPPSNVLKIASLIGLGASLLWKQKKVQYFFDKSKGNKSPLWKPSLQWKRPALVKSFAPLNEFWLEVVCRGSDRGQGFFVGIGFPKEFTQLCLVLRPLVSV